MKKILVIAIVVVMTLSAFGGFAYAQAEHEAVKGDKVVGYGPFGVFSLLSGDTEHMMSCMITNPDCVGTITLEQMTIYDSMNGVLIYEGPVVSNRWSMGSMQSMVVPELGPHESCSLIMSAMFPLDGPHNPTSWMSPMEARALDSAIYTVEITWSAKGWNCPLIGHVTTTSTRFDNQDPPNEISDYRTVLPMWSMQQRQD